MRRARRRVAPAAAAAGPDPEAGTVELRIPNSAGWERVAMDAAASVARRMGFPEARIADIRTAVSEATLNAIEHGNAGEAARSVWVLLAPGPAQLEIRVRDVAVVPLPPPDAAGGARPDLAAMVAGEVSPRGWGVFLIQNLMDEAEFTAAETGNVVRMVVRLEPRTAGG
jgi:serine/threonine-protein kinase RsbW